MGTSLGPGTRLAPGFRFHPTDEELIRYYLRRKICGKSFRFDAISEIDIYKSEPWDLPGLSRLRTRDMEWYFFSILDKKYGKSSRTNRATERGYWKTTGKDRHVYHRSRVAGMKKTLVYHSGRAPTGQRTNWVMHEYRLVDEEMEKAGFVQDAYVLCRVFQKSGAGPMNGEQYGAPFVEEEWEDEELETVPKEEAVTEVEFGDDAYLDADDIEQILGADFRSNDDPLHLGLYNLEDVINVEETETLQNRQELLMVDLDQQQNSILSELPVQPDTDLKLVKHEYAGESIQTVNAEDVEYLLGQPFCEAADNLEQYEDGLFLDANDLSNPIQPDASSFDMLEEYLTFFSANDNSLQDATFDLSEFMSNKNSVPEEISLPEKIINESTQQATMLNKKLIGNHSNVASSSNQEKLKYKSEFQNPYIKQASKMLGSVPAPPAFASEFPAKGAALHFSSLSQPSSSVRVTAGLIQITDAYRGDNGMDWSLGKHGNYDIVISFGMSQGGYNPASLESLLSILAGKTTASLSRGWFCFILLWFMIFSMSFKIGTYISAR